jgi:transcription elongation factor GreA
MLKRVPMTIAGEKMLQEELAQLKKVDRPEVIEAIADARSHGDLKENAEYHAAREKQSMMEARISQIEGSLSNSQIIDVSKMENTGKVIFGVTVELLDLDTDKEITYQIVGDDESDIKSGKISVNTPIARGLIGKQEGDEVIIKTPKGEIEYEIVKVLYI